MGNWVWDQPINGWEFLLSTTVGVLVTVASVVFGLWIALRGERASRDEFRKLKIEAEDEGVAMAVVARLRQDIDSAMLVFGAPGPLGRTHEWSLQKDLREKHWRPARLRAFAVRARKEIPESHHAIAEHIDRHIESLIAQIDEWEAIDEVTNGMLANETDKARGAISQTLLGFLDRSIPLRRIGELD